MKSKLALSAFLTAFVLCISACGGTSAPIQETTAPTTAATEFPTEPPEERTSYRCQKFDFTVSDAFTTMKNSEDYNFAFRKTGESEDDLTLLAIIELPDQHMSATAFSEGIMPDFEEDGFEDIQTDAIPDLGKDCFRFSGSYLEDGTRVQAGYSCISEGDGSLFVIFATYPETAKETYETEITKILESVTYTGKAAGTGGTAKFDHFTLDYSDAWYLADHSRVDFDLGRRVAQSECDYFTKLIFGVSQAGLTPQDAADQCMRDLQAHGEVTTGTGRMLGKDVITVGYTMEVLTHRIVIRYGFFEENDVVYQIMFRCCEDCSDTALADLEKLTLQ